MANENQNSEQEFAWQRLLEQEKKDQQENQKLEMENEAEINEKNYPQEGDEAGQRDYLNRVRQMAKEKIKEKAKETAKKATKKVAKKVGKKILGQGFKQAFLALITNPYFWIVVGIIFGLLGLYFLFSYLIAAAQEDPCFIGGLFSDFVGEACTAISGAI